MKHPDTEPGHNTEHTPVHDKPNEPEPDTATDDGLASLIETLLLEPTEPDGEPLPAGGFAAHVAGLCRQSLSPSAEAHDADVAAVLKLIEGEPRRRVLAARDDGDDDTEPLAQFRAAAAQAVPRILAAPARNITAWRDAPTPAPVLWERGSMRATGEHGRERECSAYCSVGEPAILSAPGGSGKSYLALSVALAAVTGKPPTDEGDAPELEPAVACGLGVRPGPVVVCSFEDRPVRTWGRLRSILLRPGAGWRPSSDFYPAHELHVCDDPEPLYASDGKPGAVPKPTDYWNRLWDQVARLAASLLIIDPASAAVAGINMNDSAPVRDFMRRLAAESEATGTGVLIIAHDTKAARNEAAAGGNPGAGAIAGSATWFDAARGALYLHSYGPNRLLRCTKANHGRSGRGWLLREVTSAAGAFQGFATELRGDGALTAAECEGELADWGAKAKAAASAAAEKAKARREAAENTEGKPDGDPHKILTNR